ncbi:MAG: SRPBCC family protein [Brevundimonas sp.]|jgi:hypothetical protein|uniref:SRPBCC family protein n=1 Tax=Brevundimonas sp. TaxID=1871086 RepID=UPI003918D560
MDFRVEHRIGIPLSAEDIWEVFADMERWPEWNPLYKQAEGRIGIGQPLTLREAIEGLPERMVQARVLDWVPNEQLILTEKRGWQFSVVRYFEIEPLAPRSSIVSSGQIFSGMLGEGFLKKNKGRLRASLEAKNTALSARVLGTAR